MSDAVVVTIDGPAGAGKSSAAKQLASSLGFQYLNTGSIYRAYTWAALQQQRDLSSTSDLLNCVHSTTIEFGANDHVVCDAQDISSELRKPEVTKNIHAIANNAEIRQALLSVQHDFAVTHNKIVCDGRDTGTVVFPQATVKFFLTASSIERARRRLKDLQQRGLADTTTLEELELDIEKRDDSDRTRDIAPLACPEDAIVVDNSTMNLDETVEFLKKLFESKIQAP